MRLQLSYCSLALSHRYIRFFYKVFSGYYIYSRAVSPKLTIVIVCHSFGYPMMSFQFAWDVNKQMNENKRSCNFGVLQLKCWTEIEKHTPALPAESAGIQQEGDDSKKETKKSNSDKKNNVPQQVIPDWLEQYIRYKFNLYDRTGKELWYSLFGTRVVVVFFNIYLICWSMVSFKQSFLTHWGRVTHICVSSLTIIGSDNGLSPGRRQAIIWTNAGILLIGPMVTNLGEIGIEIHIFS